MKPVLSILFGVAIFSIFLSCGKDEFDEKITPYFFDRDCQVVSPEIFDGFSEGCYIPLFVDDFSDNSNEWKLFNKFEYVQDITGGHLALSTHQNETNIWGTSMEIPAFQQTNDWEYRVHFRIESGSSGSEAKDNLILWGSDEDLENYHAFSFNGNKEYEIYEVTSAGYSSYYQGVLSSGSFVSNSYIRFTARNYQGTTYFFLNGTLFHQMPQKALHGNAIFFGAGPGNLVWVDEVGVVGL